MGDGRQSVGRLVGNLGRYTLPTAGLLSVALVAALATPAFGSAVSDVKGAKYKMANAKMANKLTRFADPANDQLRLDGRPEPDAPAWSDIKSVTVAATRMPPKLLTQMSSDYPPGAARTFYGDGRTPTSQDRVIFVAVQMAGKRPPGTMGQQVEIGVSGDAATPMQAGSETDTWVGTEKFTLVGLFSNGLFDAGTTDVSGRLPGLELEADEYYDVNTGVLGFYRPRNTTWYVVLPRAKDASAITVSVRSSTEVGSVIDRLDLPGGGHFIDLNDPTGGYRAKKDGPLLTCRALETFNGEAGTIETLAADSNLVRYTAAGDRALLASAVKAAGPVSVAASAVGGDGDAEVDVDGEAASLIVEGVLAVSEDGDAVTLEFELPEGQWTFALEGDALQTPHGERIVDHMTLTGPAGVAVGPGLDGYVAGGYSCASSAEEPVADELAEEPTADDTEAETTDEAA